MATGIGPYVVPLPVDTDPSSTVLETTFVVDHTMVDMGGGMMAHAETINGAIPGPTLMLNVGDAVIVCLINRLHHGTGIYSLQLARDYLITMCRLREHAPGPRGAPAAS